jgi:transcriptional regulator with XRE-family HTH domain
MSFDKAKYNKNLNTLFANSPKTARQIADDLDMTEATISRYRTGGRIPAFPVAVKIAEYFGVSVEWLAGADGYEIDSFNQMPASLRKMLSISS